MFYANINLGHRNPANREDCVWNLVCGTPVFLSLARIAHILQTPTHGTILDDVQCDTRRRDRVSHMFIGDDMTELKSKFL